MKRICSRLFILLICLAMILPDLAAVRVFAEPESGEEAYYYDTNNNRVQTSLHNAWNNAVNLQTGMGINRDVTMSGRFFLSSGRRVYVELNAHTLDRNMNAYSANKEGEVFYVSENATLTVYGGTRTSPSESGDTRSVRAWSTTTAGQEPRLVTKQVNGGVITGGYSTAHAGGIQIEENATVNLNYVTLMGNRAEQKGGSDGYGGGVVFNRSYGKLNMDHANIVYNYAYNDGGGIYVAGGGTRKRADFCTVRMTASHIDYNGCEDNGGGVAVDGKYFQILGDAKPFSRYFVPVGTKNMCFGGTEKRYGSTIGGNVVWDSDTGGGGGGVYVWNSNNTIAGVNIVSNQALYGGLGGGVFTRDEYITLYDCNILENYADKEDSLFEAYGGEGGGVYVNNDLTTIKDCTISENRAVFSGAGIWVDGSVDLIAGGDLKVFNNYLSNGSVNNVFLQDYVQEAHIVCSSLGKDAYIGVTLDSGHSKRIACGPEVRVFYTNVGATFDQRKFFSDDGSRYMYWNMETNPFFDSRISINKNRDDSKYDFRWIIAADRSYMPSGYSESAGPSLFWFEPDSGSNLKKMDFTYPVGEDSYNVYQGVFSMPVNSSTDTDEEETFFFSEGYFMDDPVRYNPHLATLSFALAATSSFSLDAVSDRDDDAYYSSKAVNVYNFLTDIGVRDEDVYFNEWMTSKPTSHSMGVSIGKRLLPDGKTLIIIGTRGIDYESEWSSNVTLGPDGEAYGFSEAADEVMRSLEEYASMHEDVNLEDENTLFWMSGYSRGGATVNLSAKRIIDLYHAEKRMFAYPMEPPMGGLSENDDDSPLADYRYAGIHNVINIADIVPYVGPSQMGFQRYGIDHYVPGTDEYNPQQRTGTQHIYDGSGAIVRTVKSNLRSDNTYDNHNTQLRAEMVKQLFAVNDNIIYDDYFYTATLNLVGNTIYGDNVSSLINEVSLSRPLYRNAESFIPDFFARLQSWGFNYRFNNAHETNDYRKYYSSEPYFNGVTFEEAVSTLCGIVFSLSSDDMAGMMEVFGNIMNRIDTKSIYMDYFRDNSSDWYDYGSYDSINEGNVKKMIDDLWTKVATRDDQKGYKSLYDVLPADQVNQIKAVWPSLALPLLYFVHCDYREKSADVTGTFAYNAMRLLKNHYQEVTFANLRASDSYYAGGVNNSYREAVYHHRSAAEGRTPAVRLTEVKEEGVNTRVITGDRLKEPIEILSQQNRIDLIAQPESTVDRVYYMYLNSDKPQWIRYSGPLNYERIREEGGLIEKDNDYPEASIRFYILHQTAVTKTQDIRLIFKADALVLTNRVHITDSGVTYDEGQGTLYPVGTGGTISTADLVDCTSAQYQSEFAGWNVYRGRSAPYSEITDPGEIAGMLGTDFNPQADSTSFAMLDNHLCTIAPSVRAYQYIRTIKVEGDMEYFNPRTLPGRISVILNGTAISSQKTLMWKKISEGDDALRLAAEITYDINEFAGITSLAKPDAYKTSFWFSPDTTEMTVSSIRAEYASATVTVNQEARTAKLRLEVTGEQMDLSSLCEMRIIRRDYTRFNDERTDADILAVYYAQDPSKIPYDFFPAVDFAKEHLSFEGFDKTYHVISPDRKIYGIYANGVPIIDSAQLRVEHRIIAGQKLPRLIGMTLKSGDRTFVLDEKNAESIVENRWKEESEPEYRWYQITAKKDELYAARYRTEILYRTDREDGMLSYIGGRIKFADDCKVSVIDREGAPVSINDSEIERVDDPYQSFIGFCLHFNTYHPVVIEVGNAAAVRLKHGISPHEVCFGLRQIFIPVKLNDGNSGTVLTAMPEESQIPETYDPEAVEEQRFEVDVPLTSKHYDLAGFTSVKVPVIINPAPETAVPEVRPVSGKYADSVRLNISSERENATLYYAIKTEPIRIDPDGKDLTPVPEFKPEDYQRYDSLKPVVLGSEYFGLRAFVSAYASEEGFSNSTPIVRSYDVMSSTVREDYVDPDGEVQPEVLCRMVTKDLMLWSEEVSGGWYAVNDPVSITYRIRVDGNVNLILCDGGELEAARGIEVDEESSLTIWCQKEGTGVLWAGKQLRRTAAPGIGAGPDCDAGDITINGGTVYAYGGCDSAGIGSSLHSAGGSVTVNNGYVSAQGGAASEQTETGHEGGPGIGSGPEGSGMNIVITGGRIEAKGADGACGIGGKDSTISLSWRNEDADYISAASYSGVLTLDEQKPFSFEGEGTALTAQEIAESINRTIVPALWQAPVYTWIDEYRQVKAQRTRIDGTKTEEETVWTAETVITDAKCETPGVSTFTAVFENPAFKTQVKENVSVAPRGHQLILPVIENLVPATCETPGSQDNVYYCERCHKECLRIHQELPPTGHDWDDGVISVKPTCTTAGERTYTCRNDHSHTRTEEIPAAHTWGPWKVVTEPAEGIEGWEERECEICHAKEGKPIPAKTHVHGLWHYERVEPTCINIGSIEHWRCMNGDSPCGRYFSDADGTQLIMPEDVVIPATGHAWGEWVVTKEATCSETGSRTRTCTHDSSHQETEVIDKLSHEPGEPETKVTEEPTCTEPGTETRTYKCIHCGEKLTEETIPLPALGHDFGPWTVTKEATETEDGEETRTCQRPGCTHTETRIIPKGHQLIHVDRSEPDCISEGNIEYWLCRLCGRYFSDAEAEHEIPRSDTVIPAKGHEWLEPSYEWAEDNTMVTASHMCSSCGEEESETVRTEWMIIKEPTETEEGEMKVTARFTIPEFTEQTRTVSIPPLGPQPAERYDLWVGSEQFTADHLTIKFARGGTAVFDPADSVLTLNDPVFGPEDYHAFGSEEKTARIFSNLERSLVIEGTADIPEGTDYGIFSDMRLIINGEGTAIMARGSLAGAQAGEIDVLKGTLTGIGTQADSAGVKAPSSYITVNGGVLRAQGQGPAVYGGTLALREGLVEAQSLGEGSLAGAVYTEDDITLSAAASIIEPEDGAVASWPDETGNINGKTIRNQEGSGEVAMKAVITTHVHDFIFSADGAFITAQCGENCYLPDHKVSLQLLAPQEDDLIVDGTRRPASFNAQQLNTFNQAAGRNISEADIIYRRGDETLPDAPADAGTYTAEITLNDVKISETETGSVTAKVEYTIRRKEPEVSEPKAVKDLRFNGSEQALNTAGSAKGGTMYYAVTDEEQVPSGGFTETVPAKKGPGTWYVWYKVIGDESHGDIAPKPIKVTIAKGAAPAIAADQKPSAAEGLEADGNSHELLIAPKKDVPGYEIQYSLDGTEWSKNIPAAKDAGEYVVKVKYASTDPNYEDSSVMEIKAAVHEISYSFASGADATWTKGSDTSLDFRIVRSYEYGANTAYKLFAGVQVDGMDVSSASYTVFSGSVILKFHVAWLETLSAGSHKLTVAFRDGRSVSAAFQVAENSSGKGGSSQDSSSSASGSSSGNSTYSGSSEGTNSSASKRSTPRTYDPGVTRYIYSLALSLLCALVSAILLKRKQG